MSGSPEKEAAAGVALYRAIQGSFEKCPWCKTTRLTHKPGCPVDDYMLACALGPYHPNQMADRWSLPGER